MQYTLKKESCHIGNFVIMGAIASQITSLTIVYSIVYSDADQRKHQSSASLAFVRGIHRGPVNSLHKWPIMQKMFPFDDVVMLWWHWGSCSAKIGIVKTLCFQLMQSNNFILSPTKSIQNISWMLYHLWIISLQPAIFTTTCIEYLHKRPYILQNCHMQNNTNNIVN